MTKYDLQLKGYVGGADFDRKEVDRKLAANSGKHVNVLIDSLGGSLATGLSVSAAFRNHGDVSVHFVGLNASAATIASLGAAHISIDAGAMYLVHKCSMSFFEWGSLNSDQFAELIRDCEKVRADLDKLDLNCARLYAARCKRKPEDLLELMKAGGWLTAQEALEWGFVDEITDLDEEKAPKLTDALASAMASEGMPIPDIPMANMETGSAFSRFLTALTSFFRSEKSYINAIMNKTYTHICAVLGIGAVALADGKASLTESQLDQLEAAIAERDRKLADAEAKAAGLDAKIAELQARLDGKPAETSGQVVDDGKSGGASTQKNEVEEFVDTYNSARALYNEV